MTYTITPCRAVFTRRGYAVRLFNDAGSAHAVALRIEGYRERRMLDSGPFTFFGNDGRKVRAEAIRFAKEHLQKR